MLKYLLISIVIVPVLLGIVAADRRVGQRDIRLLVTGWLVYSALWIGLLYYLKMHWVG